MNDTEIMHKADKAIQELDQYINTYQPLAWGMSWDIAAIDKLQRLIEFYQDRKRYWLKLLAGASEAARQTFLNFMACADLEIEAAEDVLWMIQGKQ